MYAKQDCIISNIGSFFLYTTYSLTCFSQSLGQGCSFTNKKLKFINILWEYMQSLVLMDQSIASKVNLHLYQCMNDYIYRHFLIPFLIIISMNYFWGETEMIFEVGHNDEKDAEDDKPLDTKYLIFFVILQTNFLTMEQASGIVNLITILIVFVYYFVKLNAANQIDVRLETNKFKYE